MEAGDHDRLMPEIVAAEKNGVLKRGDPTRREGA
jgi:hypothetical protein